MKTFQGFYSVIQYCPDPFRMEAVNVGVALFCPELGFVDAWTIDSNARIKKVFGQAGFDGKFVNLARESMENRIRGLKGEIKSEEDFARFAASRGNDIVLTEPRSTRVTEPDNDLNDLAEKLVDGQHLPKKKAVRTFPEIDAIFNQTRFEKRLIKMMTVKIPILGDDFVAPYAYQNGTLNLIKPENFEVHGKERAWQIATKAGLLQERGTENGKKCKVIVIDETNAKKNANGSLSKVNQLLEHYKIEVIPAGQIEQFADRVEHEAEELEDSDIVK